MKSKYLYLSLVLFLILSLLMFVFGINLIESSIHDKGNYATQKAANIVTALGIFTPFISLIGILLTYITIDKQIEANRKISEQNSIQILESILKELSAADLKLPDYSDSPSWVPVTFDLDVNDDVYIETFRLFDITNGFIDFFNSCDGIDKTFKVYLANKFKRVIHRRYGYYLARIEMYAHDNEKIKSLKPDTNKIFSFVRSNS